MASNVTCPNCSSAVPYTKENVGKSVKCQECGTDIMVVGVPEQPSDLMELTCGSCGGAMKMVPGVAKLTCEFCGSTYFMPSILKAEEKREGGLDCPKFLTPFAFEEKGVLEKLVSWLEGGMFTPGDADKVSKIVKLDGFYAPTYVFECDATSQWTGEYSTTHSRPVTRTRYNATTKRRETYTDHEQYKDWHRTSGTHKGNYRTPVTGDDAALSQSDLDNVADDRARYSNDEGAGPLATADPGRYEVKQPAITPEDAWARGRRLVEEFERSACSGEVERLHSCNTEISGMKARLVFQPIWNLIYLYKNKKFNAVMDGRTGGVSGKRPVSKTKIVIAIILAVIVAIIIIVCVICVGGGYVATEAGALAQLAAQLAGV
ncbi:MAG: hypothetical protein JSW52_11915 [Candidatus Coatesbacteria bacterium]|nr:MAG: hypothetical protein JSW52_11915 [Candidatus Coatesbacteria bacterium]